MCPVVESEKPQLMLHLVLVLFRVLVRCGILRQHLDVPALIHVEGHIRHYRMINFHLQREIKSSK